MYKCSHFKIQELVPPAIFEARGEKAWELLDERLLITLDRLRDRFGPITVNNWHSGKDREWSGLRTKESPYYSATSQHSFGRAADCLFSHTDAESVRQEILAAPDDKTFELIGSVELGTSWLHFDVRNCKRIKTYYP
ncbi:MAG: hypothetical protein COW19_10975 [Zetaproteobacteria bacterium CG12_big_fil_rev_8_21_14_0_65_55_1124]|nr:MAG: hypothetical protein AUJ58_02175 [Zetaproteobacteria bacterium CG1_02_55_237]PIS18987.1 MAG: hypothetical protein COT53_08010 [Zetaproteobacteria bacterium CG08_land_8_20_14_0_20_55_17]PIW41910.1 MAG: hypothetical protein COW19_10975 [Zetaproteobacteria bacterium CG12_big_fil_rev_8_21_14_0_65_55_1124]PIY53525.1 MAG: hypothetical protein COZ01_03520 [Zetaproteobacteria bacterium CG_4_10_14_0_8_um_filter_55_43]PIZ37395.1 MAG: hypothetical protein COY36_09365 [Zetaproteobacteria bacterium 